MATNRTFWLLLVFWGCASAVFGTLLTLLAQVLCPYGYTDVRIKCSFKMCNHCLEMSRRKEFSLNVSKSEL